MPKQLRKIPFAGKVIVMFLINMMCTMSASAGAIHVSTNGNDNNPGDEKAPLLTIHKAVEMVMP